MKCWYTHTYIYTYIFYTCTYIHIQKTDKIIWIKDSVNGWMSRHNSKEMVSWRKLEKDGNRSFASNFRWPRLDDGRYVATTKCKSALYYSSWQDQCIGRIAKNAYISLPQKLLQKVTPLELFFLWNYVKPLICSNTPQDLNDFIIEDINIHIHACLSLSLVDTYRRVSRSNTRL